MTKSIIALLLISFPAAYKCGECRVSVQKTVHKPAISLHECNAICKRQTSPLCRGLDHQPGKCILQNNQTQKHCTDGDPRPETCNPRNDKPSESQDAKPTCTCPEGFVNPFVPDKTTSAQDLVASCYIILSTAPWLTAKENCQKLGSNLVAIETLEEQKHIQNMLIRTAVGAEAVWTSGTREVMSDLKIESWKWHYGDITNTYWGKDEPSNSDNIEFCISLAKNRGYLWNDDKCHRKYNPLCEIKKQTLPCQ